MGDKALGKPAAEFDVSPGAMKSIPTVTTHNATKLTDQIWFNKKLCP